MKIKLALFLVLIINYSLKADWTPASSAMSVENLPVGSKLVLAKRLTLKGGVEKTRLSYKRSNEVPPVTLSMPSKTTFYGTHEISCDLLHDVQMFDRNLEPGETFTIEKSEVLSTSLPINGIPYATLISFEVTSNQETGVKNITCRDLNLTIKYNGRYETKENSPVRTVYFDKEYSLKPPTPSQLSCNLIPYVWVPDGKSNPNLNCTWDRN